MEGVMEGGRRRASREGKCISCPILVFEICKGGYMLLMQIRWGGDGWAHVCEGQRGPFSTNLTFFLAALERLTERGKKGRWEREGGRQAGRFRGEMFPGPCRLFLAATAAPRAAAPPPPAAANV